MTILTYTMQTTMLPSFFCNQICQLVRDFIRGSSNSVRKTSLVSWHDMCQPTTHGGNDIMNLRTLNKAFIMKVSFNIIAQPYLFWVTVLRYKY